MLIEIRQVLSQLVCALKPAWQALKGEGEGEIWARESLARGLAPEFPSPSLSNACHAG